MPAVRFMLQATDLYKETGDDSVMTAMQTAVHAIVGAALVVSPALGSLIMARSGHPKYGTRWALCYANPPCHLNLSKMARPLFYPKRNGALHCSVLTTQPSSARVPLKRTLTRLRPLPVVPVSRYTALAASAVSAAHLVYMYNQLDETAPDPQPLSSITTDTLMEGAKRKGNPFSFFQYLNLSPVVAGLMGSYFLLSLPTEMHDMRMTLSRTGKLQTH